MNRIRAFCDWNFSSEKVCLFIGLFVVVTYSNLILCSSTFAQQPLIELSTRNQTVQGRNVFHNEETCYLQQRDGQIREVNRQEITSFREVLPNFQPFSGLELKSKLQEEFGRGQFVLLKGEFLLISNSENSRKYAELCDETYRSFQHFFTIRGFDLDKREFPLVVIVFKNRQEFATYCKADKIPFSPLLRGYYHPQTHRVALYEQDNTSNSEDLENTLVHEVTHQLCFDAGLYSRLGDNPKWLVEGLAMIFEGHQARATSMKASILSRVNPERMIWFGKYSESSRLSGQLVETISSDSLFATSVLDAYSEAWALTFYLMETHRDQFVAYLKHVAKSSNRKDYSSEERFTDFKKFFGDETNKLEGGFLRFMAKLNSSTSRTTHN